VTEGVEKKKRVPVKKKINQKLESHQAQPDYTRSLWGTQNKTFDVTYFERLSLTGFANNGAPGARPVASDTFVPEFAGAIVN